MKHTNRPAPPDAIVSIKVRSKVLPAEAGSAEAAFDLHAKTRDGKRLSLTVPAVDLQEERRVLAQFAAKYGLYPDRGHPDIAKDLQLQPHKDLLETTRTGWLLSNGRYHFVTPGRVVGPDARRLRLRDDGLIDPQIGQQAGTLKEWQSSVGRLLKRSSFGITLVGATLAAPLLRLRPQEETFGVFIVGPSTSGKSKLLDAVQSFQGRPGKPLNPASTGRGIEEAAASHNDLLLPIGDLAQLDPTDAGRLIKYLAYDVTLGQGRRRSKAVAGHLPQLTYRTIICGTSETPSLELSGGAPKIRQSGERVRCFDLQTSPDRGVFDRRYRGKGAQEGAKLADALSDAASRFYGTPLIQWLRWIGTQEEDALRLRLDEDVERFVEAVGVKDRLQQRVARKFGLTYAALRMAKRAKVVKWSADLCLRSVLFAFESAIRSVGGDDTNLGQAAGDELIAHLKRSHSILKSGKRADKADPSWLGFKFKRKGKPAIGVYPTNVYCLMGKARGELAANELERRGILVKGLGSARPQASIGRSGGTIRVWLLEPRTLASDI